MKYGIIALTLCGAALLFGCKKDDKNLGTGSPVQNGAQNYMKGRTPKPQSLLVRTSANDTVRTKTGIYFAVPAKSFTDANGALLGQDTVELLVTECQRNGDFINNFLSTAETGKGILSCGGAFYLEARYKGKPAKLVQPIRAFIPTADVQPNPAWQVFDLEDNSDKIDGNARLWRSFNQEPDALQDPLTLRYHYSFTIDRFAWYGLGRYRDISQGKVAVQVEMPFGALVKRSVAAFVMPDTGLVYLYPDEQRNRFNTAAYKVPKGQVLRLLIIEKNQNNLSYCLQPFVVNSDTLLRPNQAQYVSQEQLDNILKTL